MPRHSKPAVPSHIKESGRPLSSEITPEQVYFNRRTFTASALSLAATAAVSAAASPAAAAVSIGSYRPWKDSTTETQTTWEQATTYNNFYELGLDKEDPSRYGASLKTEPWTLEIAGEVGKPQKIAIEDIVRQHPLEERIYRLRCVEAWSMVIPWLGFPLADLLAKVEPTSKAKFVEFQSINDPENLRGQRSDALEWPYVEGLRIDEAMHPLTFLSVGLYGRALPPQNGAPIRLVVPWKYGFKSAKSIVRIALRETMPLTSWPQAIPQEYGFYSNVNPAVNHRRWSQASERRIDESSQGLRALFRARQETLPFNGYADQVASLYSGMDLKANF